MRPLHQLEFVSAPVGKSGYADRFDRHTAAEPSENPENSVSCSPFTSVRTGVVEDAVAKIAAHGLNISDSYFDDVEPAVR
jgi:hypothetical protein